ncbi:MAG: DUF2007 domain-containing protein [Flavobacteriaceae bacterium]|jgi:hypothetical protein|nr:DUF2007 domain-containing protein [Flavobacteriaceae bacterium]
MNDSFTLLCASNVIETQRVKALLEEHNIFPIIKDESESARLAGFGAASMMQQVWVANSDLEKAKSLI